MNYGGGAGRDRVTAITEGGNVVQNARVELYDAAGNFVSSTLTNAAGQYVFSGLAAGNYTVRVVNSTVPSNRTGYAVATHLAIQTYRTNASTGAPIDVTDHVGGEVSNKVDAGNGSTTLGALNTSTTAVQSITSLTIGTSDVLNVDFGYSFNVVTNTNNAGQGSLRQFIINANGLGNLGLAINGQPAGQDVSIFMISDGTAQPGLNVGMPDQLNAGVATLLLSSALPTITAGNTSIDASTQTTNVGNTNAGLVGTGGTVGVDAIPLPQYPKPEVAINAKDFNGLAVNGNASGIFIQGLAIYNASNGISVSGGNGTNNLVRNVLVGSLPNGADPVGALRNTSHGILISSPSTYTVDKCYVGWNGLSGVLGTQPSASVTATYNEIFAGGWTSESYDGLDIDGVNCTVRFNLSRDNVTRSGSFNCGGGNGIELGSTNNTGQSNTLLENNTLLGNTSSGISIRNGMRGATARRNIISGNTYGVIVVTPSGTTTDGNKITENSIYSNTLLGIDVATNGGNPDGVSPNDGTTNSLLANLGMDYPIITACEHVAGVLTVSGYVGSAPNQSAFAGAFIELFISDNDGTNNGEMITGDGLNVPHGEGRTCIGTLITDASGNFSGTMATTAVTAGDMITATATGTDNNTSEFGTNAQVNLAPVAICQNISITVDGDGNASIVAAQVDNGSYDPEAIMTLAVSPSTFTCANAGPNDVTLTVTDDQGLVASCVATVTVIAPDNDGDGVCDAIDLDDDNDGIPDNRECLNNFQWSSPPSVSGNTAAGTIYGISYTYTSSSPVQTTAAVYAHSIFPPAFAVPNSNPTIKNSQVTTNTLDFGIPIKDPVLVFASIGAGISVPIDFSNPVQILFSQAVVQNTPTRITGTEGYAILRMNGTFTTISFNYTVAENFANFVFGADFIIYCDTDGDGVPNHLDLDSDNDGIYDLVEARHTAPDANQDGIIDGAASAFGTSGLFNGLETIVDNGLVNYTITDSDNDANIDSIELDSDNDGCADVIEAGFIDTNGDGSPGNSPVLVNAHGLVTSLTP